MAAAGAKMVGLRTDVLWAVGWVQREQVEGESVVESSARANATGWREEYILRTTTDRQAP
jgi:hypothetical protein